MKRIALLLLLCLALPARADDIQGVWWNSTVGYFQALARAAGVKFIPDAEHGSYTTAFTGPRTTSSLTINFARSGPIVVLDIPTDVGGTCTSGVIKFTASTAMPASIRPKPGSSFIGCLLVKDNGSDQANCGEYAVTSAGLIEIYRNFTSSTWSTGAACGWYEAQIYYMTK